jgi:phosphatidylglycerophosphatase A
MSVPAQVATFFGVGRLAHAPGTWGSLAALIIAIPVMMFGRWEAIAILALLATIAGVWASDHYASECGLDDPQDCVIDEVAGQWIACAVAGLASMPDESALSAGGFFLCFVLFRLFDIAKPGPVGWAERKFAGGLGIMLDDVFAGLIAGFVVFLFGYSGFL